MDLLSTANMDQDEKLIRRILAGEKRLFEQLMRRHNESLFKIGMSILYNDTDVEDAMQTAYINAYEHLPDFKFKSAFGTWLKRILINECFLQWKKKKRSATAGLSEMKAAGAGSTAEINDSPVDKIINKELGGALEKALWQIPEKYRIVFVMREIEELSVSETVEVLSLTEANVKVRLNRAKAMLRDQINDYYKSDAVFPFHLSRCDRIVGRVLQQLGI
jgi:RNA polymerase sigma-70 factor (ECF subfamily)